MATFYNDNDTKITAWQTSLAEHNLIAADAVTSDSIHDISPAQLKRYDRCHFFAGIAGWELALQYAGWPADRPVWTGSCPCQPFSSAGKGLGTSDPRHLWPEFRRLIKECRPATIFGEQVASKAGRLWLDRVRADLEALGYAVGAADLCAAGINSPHIRQRLFWVADAEHLRTRAGNAGEQGKPPQHGRCRPANAGTNGVAQGDTVNPRLERHAEHGGDRHQPGRINAPAHGSTRPSSWDNFELVRCVEPTKEPGRCVEKRRRIEPGLVPLAHGIPGRVVRLRGYGNAIVPQLAATFIQSFMEIN